MDSSLEELTALCRRNAHGQSPLHLAVAAGQTALLLATLDARGSGAREARVADPDQFPPAKMLFLRDSNNDTPLHYAAWQNAEVFSKLLLEAMSHLPNSYKPGIYNTTNKSGAHALLAACLAGHEALALQMLELPFVGVTADMWPIGFDVNQTDCYGRSAFFYACQNGLSRVVTALCEKPDTRLDVPTHAGVTPLIVAAKAGHSAVCAVLLRNGADIGNRVADTEETALHFAASRNHGTVASELLAAGASVDMVDQLGNSALHKAAAKGHVALLRKMFTMRSKGLLAALLHKNKSGETALHVALRNASNKASDTALEIINRVPGSDDNELRINGEYIINAQTADKTTPLMLAAAGGFVGVVRALLDRGALLELKDEASNTALLWACQRGHDEIGRILVSKGAVIWTRNRTQATALHYACQFGLFATVSEMVKCEAPLQEVIGMRDLTKATPLMLACAAGEKSSRIVNLLIEHTDAEQIINFRNDDYKTALHFACAQGSVSIVDLLIQHGADRNLRVRGRTPLLCACMAGHEELAQYLVRKEHEAEDLFAIDETNSTAMHYAIRKQMKSFFRKYLDKFARHPTALDTRDSRRRNLLHLACQVGNVEFVRGLMELSEPLDFEAFDDSNRSPFYYACEGGFGDVVDVFLSMDAVPNTGLVSDMGTRSQNFPILAAAEKGHERLVKRLFQYFQANKKKMETQIHFIVNKRGENLLHVCSRKGLRSAVSAILKSDASYLLMKRSLSMDTPLHLACEHGQSEVALLLIASTKEKKESDLWDNANVNKMTPFNYALRKIATMGSVADELLSRLQKAKPAQIKNALQTRSGAAPFKSQFRCLTYMSKGGDYCVVAKSTTIDELKTRGWQVDVSSCERA